MRKTGQEAIVSYEGEKDSFVEEKIESLSLKHGGHKDGNWTKTEESTACSFIFKWLMNVDAFRKEAQSNIAKKIKIGYK